MEQEGTDLDGLWVDVTIQGRPKVSVLGGWWTGSRGSDPWTPRSYGVRFPITKRNHYLRPLLDHKGARNGSRVPW